MKRILPLVLTVLLLPALLAFPAMADEVTSPWVNVLDYSTLDDSGANYIYLYDNDPFYYTLPSKGTVFGIDLLVYCRYGIESVQFCRDETENDWLDAFIYEIGDGVYRIIGGGKRVSWEKVYIKIDTDVSSSSTRALLNILSFNVSYTPTTSGVLNASLTGLVGTGDSFSAQYTGTTVTASWDTVGSGYDERHFSSYIRFPDNWQAYDYIDIILTLWVDEIDSITADDGIYSLPVEVTPLYQVGQATQPGTANNIISVRIDLRGMDRSGSNYPLLRISGYSYTAFNSFAIAHCSGIALTNEISPITFWIQQVGGWFSSQTSSIGNWFNQQISAVQTWGKNITDSVATWGKNIVNAISGKGDASQVQDNINSAVGELEDVQSVMDSVSRPELNAIDFNVSGMLDTSAVAVYGNIFSTLIGNQYMTNILMIAFILAAASFLLFGRR